MIAPRDRPYGGVVVAEARGAGWAIEVIQNYALIPLRPPAVRADDFVRKVLAEGPVGLNGILLAARAIGLAAEEIEAALQRADVICTPGAGHHVQCELPPGPQTLTTPRMPSVNALRRHLAELERKLKEQ